MEIWNNIYEIFNPVAFSIFGLKVHWYGLMYASALIVAIQYAKYIVKKDSINITNDHLDTYIIYVEIGVVLGARLGYLLFYSDNPMYYITNPLQIFNPFSQSGEFVGISGMSYHGALIGFLIGTLIYIRKYDYKFWMLMDLVAISVPLGYIFGRIGNFLNKELIGMPTDMSIGIYVDGILRHPSQLYEAILEGLLIAIVIYIVRNKKVFKNRLIFIYLGLYAIARFVVEFVREPDANIGYICCDWLSMGQFLSIIMFVGTILLFLQTRKYTQQ